MPWSLLSVEKVLKIPTTGSIVQRVAPDLSVILEPDFSPPYQDAAERVKFVGAVPQALDAITLPNHLALESRDLILPPAKVFQVGRNSIAVRLYSIYM